MKPIITLTTDLGIGDYYLAAVKAKLASQDVDCQVIDISNSIEKFNLSEAAFVLKNALPNFPDNSIHIVGVSPGAIDEGRHLLFRHQKQYIITHDNGLFSLITDSNPELVVEININLDTDHVNFPTRDLYAPTAILLARGVTPEVIGKRIETFERRTLLQPMIGEDYIKGVVAYVDSYGNAISNISKDMFEHIGKGRAFAIGFIYKGYEMDQIEERYSDASEGDRLAIFNSSGLLEIAVYHGNASHLLGLEKGESIIVSFG